MDSENKQDILQHGPSSSEHIKNDEQICTPEKSKTQDHVVPNFDWTMFDIVSTLGKGAYGQVYKVKCLQSTRVCDNGGERVLLSQKSIKKAKSVIGQNTKPQGRQLLKDQFYVIKVIDVAEVPDNIGLEAMQEIEIMQLMDSPYIVGYLDSFIDGQKINIVLEYCPMGDLNSLVEKQKVQGKPFVDNMIWKIFIHLCLGIEYLHSKDIIHRDLKTLNVFMIKENVAKIGDLGCALQIENANPAAVPAKDIDLQYVKQMSLESNPFDVITGDDDLLMGDCNLLEIQDQAGASASFINDLNQATKIAEAKTPTPVDDQPTVGTPYYLAPEIWKSKQYGKESDIWALGVILYEMCCLKYPFPATELKELEQKVLNEKLEKYPNGVNSEFIDLFTKMLKKDTTKRPCIEEIIYSDIFQTNAVKNLITLPLKLNKQKLQHKFSLYGGQLDEQLEKLEVVLTDKQKKLIGILTNSELHNNSKNKPNVPNRTSMLGKNFSKLKAPRDGSESPKKPVDAKPADSKKEIKSMTKPTKVESKPLTRPANTTVNKPATKSDSKPAKSEAKPSVGSKTTKTSNNTRLNAPSQRVVNRPSTAQLVQKDPIRKMTTIKKPHALNDPPLTRTRTMTQVGSIKTPESNKFQSKLKQKVADPNYKTTAKKTVEQTMADDFDEVFNKFNQSQIVGDLEGSLGGVEETKEQRLSDLRDSKAPETTRAPRKSLLCDDKVKLTYDKKIQPPQSTRNDTKKFTSKFNKPQTAVQAKKQQPGGFTSAANLAQSKNSNVSQSTKTLGTGGLKRTSTLKGPSTVTSAVSTKNLKSKPTYNDTSKTIPVKKYGAPTHLSKSYAIKPATPSGGAAPAKDPPKKPDSSKKDNTFLHNRRSTVTDSPMKKGLDDSSSSKKPGSSLSFGSKNSAPQRMQFSSHQEKVISEQKIKVEVVIRNESPMMLMDNEEEKTQLRTSKVGKPTPRAKDEVPKSFKEKLQEKKNSQGQVIKDIAQTDFDEILGQSQEEDINALLDEEEDLLKSI